MLPSRKNPTDPASNSDPLPPPPPSGPPLTLTYELTSDEDEEEDKEGWDKIFAVLADPLSLATSRGGKGLFKGFFSGVEVSLPFPKAYKSQKQMISKVMDGVQRGENCLLESPTGTGKTAALLCALLAWQEDCIQKGRTIDYFFKEKRKALEAAGVRCSCGLVPDQERLLSPPVISEEPKGSKKFFLTAMLKLLPKTEEEEPEPAASASSQPSSSDSNSTITTIPFPAHSPSSAVGSPLKRLKLETSSVTPDHSPLKSTSTLNPCLSTPKQARGLSASAPTDSYTITRAKEELCELCVKSYFSKDSLPKIFYATRTHSQVAQVVAELKSSPYKDTKMTILGSRKQSCILPPEKIADALKRAETDSTEEGVVTFLVQNQNQKPQPDLGVNLNIDLDEGCKVLRRNFYWNQKPKNEALQRTTCPYFLPKPDLKGSLSHCDSLSSFKVRTSAWDIEDLKSFGKEEGLCPYYTSQVLLDDAKIVFCPYNYLIYPEIRKALQLDLTGSVIVFDEAHNLEDICRDSASMKIKLYSLDMKRRNLDDILQRHRLATNTDKGKVQRQAAEFLSNLLQRLSTWMRKKAPELPKRKIVYETQNTPRVPRSKHLDFSGEEISQILEEIGLGPDDLDLAWENLANLKSESSSEGSSQEGESSTSSEDDFHVPSSIIRFAKSLLRSIQFLHDASNQEHYRIVLVHQARKDGHDDEILLQVLCLSPAVAFKAIRDSVHSVIVASGTLSPLNSFELELETPFRRKLTAAHVVPEQHVLSCCLHTTKSGLPLDLRKRSQETDVTQDQVGQLILEVCQVVPHGILVFLPSYSFMQTLRARWSRNGILSSLQNVKELFWEEQEKTAFEREMMRYKTLISEGKGCLLFAIFRGKISEGLNFRDDQARAVITLGIPFPNREAPEVKFKQSYNNARRKKKKGSDYLTGSEWYDCQTFRAMNQAFGRCIRHEKDWGALILLEVRFSEQRYSRQLSQWVRKDLEQFEKIEDLKERLKTFVAERKNADKEDK